MLRPEWEEIVLVKYDFKTWDALLAAVGYGGMKEGQGVNRLKDEYLKENKFRLREEVGTTADFYKGTNQDYIVHCEVRENKAVLIGLDLSVPDKEQAEAVCGAWRRKSQEIYSHVMHTLLS